MADADEATTAAIAELLNQDALEVAWANGEDPTRRNASDDDDDYAPSGAAVKKRKPAAARPAAAPKAPKAAKSLAEAGSGKVGKDGKDGKDAPPRPPSVSLLDLLRAGLLRPGAGVLSSSYGGVTHCADLGPAGVLHFRGDFFANLSSWTLHVKRLTNPERKADDGWKCTMYQGELLDALKKRLQAQRLNDGTADAHAHAATGAPTAAPAVAAVAAPAAAAFPPPSRAPASPQLDAPLPPRELTDYVRQRPKRERHAPVRLASSAGGDSEEGDLLMVSCEPYASDLAAAQASQGGLDDVAPFSVRVSSSAALLMDAHAHLSTAEVIGFLGGTWERHSRIVRVVRAMPAGQLVSGDGAVEVELDPSSMPAILGAFEAEGLQVVGWYHSHPLFATQPSVRDVANQGAYQNMFQGSPFLGAIVGPYDARLPDTQSDFRWFHVESDSGARGGGWPRQLAASREDESQLRASLEDDLRGVSQRFADTLLRADLAGVWRDGLSRRDKLRASLRAHLPADMGEQRQEEALHRLLAVVDAAWAHAGDAAA